MKKRIITRASALIMALFVTLALAACGAAPTPGGAADSSSRERSRAESAPPAREETPVEELIYGYDSKTEGIEIKGYTGTSIHVVIPETIEGESVTSIGARAFEDSGIKDIWLPPTVVSIGESAFEGSGLILINIPDGMNHIGTYAFKDLSSDLQITYLGKTGDLNDLHQWFEEETGQTFKSSPLAGLF